MLKQISPSSLNFLFFFKSSLNLCLFGALMGWFRGRSRVPQLFWGLLIVEQLLFSMFPSIVTFDFGLIFGSFLTFWGPASLYHPTQIEHHVKISMFGPVSFC